MEVFVVLSFAQVLKTCIDRENIEKLNGIEKCGSEKKRRILETRENTTKFYKLKVNK